MPRAGSHTFALFAVGVLSTLTVLAEPVPAPKASASQNLPAATPAADLTLPKIKLPKTEEPKEKQIYSLVDAINLALQNNPQILEAQKRIEEAQGGKIVARAGILPSLTSNGIFQHREDDYAQAGGADPNRTSEDWNVNIRLTQNIYNGGRVRSEIAISKLQEESRLLDYQGVVDEIVMEVRLAFYDILQARAAVDVRKQAVNLLEKQFVEQQNAFRAGTVGKLNVFRAEVSLANELPALLESENRLADGKVRLSKLLAVPYLIRENAVPFDIHGDLDYKKVSVDLNDCLAKAEAFRPELKARNLDIQIREKEIVIARSAQQPQVGVAIGYDFLNEPYTNTPQETENGYVAAVSATWQIFDGFATDGRVKQARARVGVAMHQRDTTRDDILAEVRSSYLQLKQAEATVESQEQNTTLAREAYVLVQASFSAGLATQLDILQSRSDLTNAQLAELNAQALHKTALARLQRAISSQVRLIQEQTSSPPTPLSPVRNIPTHTPPAPTQKPIRTSP